MKRASLAVFILALAVASAWPLSSAIGAATGSASTPSSDVRPVGCVPAPSTDDAAPSAEDLGLPPGHPPIPMDRLPPGHPPIGQPRLPPGHPPISSGHPPIPATPGALFGEPVLLTI
jgi:hypothetical protein